MQPEVVTVLTGQGVGSGVIYRANGIILTNAHVAGANREGQIAFADGTRERGNVLAADRDTDLALVKVDRKDLPVATVPAEAAAGGRAGGRARQPARVPEIGHRRDRFRAPPRDPRLRAGNLGAGRPLADRRADLAGNSGGAVVDGQGHVIAIDEAHIPPEQGPVAIGFAIPAATAISVADELLKTGHVEYAFVGIQPAQLTPQLARELGIREPAGVLVYALSPGGPADRAGIRPGDVLVKLAGKPLQTVEDLFAALRAYRPGQKVAIELMRGGRRETVQVKLSAKPQ